MSIKNTYSKLLIGVGVIVALIASNPNAFAKTVKMKGSDQGTTLTANFSFDGVASAISIIFTGKDNLGGEFNGQDVGEYSFTGSSCTAPDSSAGIQFVLVQAQEVINYEDGQLYSSGVGAGDGTGCASNTTGSYGLTETHTVTGGTGKFASASGSITGSITGKTLAAPGSPPASLGEFTGFQATVSGSVAH